MDYDKFDLEHYQKLQGEVQQLRAELAQVVDAANRVSGVFRGYDQVEACWGCDMNFSEHDKHDPECAVLNLHKVLASMQIKRKPLAVAKVTCSNRSKYGWVAREGFENITNDHTGTLFIWPNEEGE